ncbi:hypothetical protein POF50_030650 [Streptomyces sp. SL13]|uniref:Methylamine utilisation protein MauE domain-containing protein n=1 Tax=Streptantibioticus silvisoli TaxID=2705255 RepID=A0AA90KJL8_9ACTN|nr:MauE/DoxX family redox-associated membrane protein [Streptantibioticus silvisoli]MDI5973649.1 hypothetical protein [Streptantibioticus silvisoli]
MASLITNLAPLALGVLLIATGVGKAFGRQVARQAAGTVLVRVLNDGRRATLVLRATGVAELVIAAGLLAAPTTVVPAVAGTALGVGFVGYLGYARVTAPESSCGCTARDNGPVSWRSFVRAGLVVAGGAFAIAARSAWWTQADRHPVTAVAFLAVTAALLVAVSRDLDHLWLTPLRKARIKVFGHPLTAAAADVPVAASVQLLERSLAWTAASPVVRSGLIDHWEADGWRFLQYSGVHETPQGGARPVTVLFSLDPHDTIDTAPSPAVRVTLIDDISDELVDVDLTEGFVPTLPMA